MSNAPRHYIMQAAIKRKYPGPCKNCADRTLGCHGSCGKYNEFKEKLQTENIKVFELYKNERRLEAAEINNKMRQIKTGNRGRAKRWEIYEKGVWGG